MEIPMIPDSASGVSITRCSPKSFSSPSVIRNTPPRVPTSSPSSTTRSSASMASRSAVLSALAIVICAISGSSRLRGDLRLDLLQPPPLRPQGGGRVGVHVVDQVGQRRVGQVLHGGADLGGDPVGLGLDVAFQLLGPQPGLLQEGAVAADRLARLPHVELVDGAVAGGVVGGGVGAEPVGERLDQGGAAALAGP